VLRQDPEVFFMLGYGLLEVGVFLLDLRKPPLWVRGPLSEAETFRI
jgi:hypothetical protein